jgi:Flp pilus assembly protein CpaB
MRRRSPRVVLAWIVTAVIALVTIRVVATDLGALDRQAHALGPNVAVVLATRDLAIGTTVVSADLRIVTRPRSTVAPDALHDIELAIGRVVVVPLLRDDVVRAAHLAAADRRGLDAVVPVGRRAVHVVVKDGFRPPVGAVVDVLASFDPASTVVAGARGRATTVATGALVLAVDDPSDSGTNGGSGVTVLVDETTAPTVAFASSFGAISLTLAPPESACCG